MLVCRMLLAENQETNQKRDFKLERNLHNLLRTWCSWADKMIELEEKSEVMTGGEDANWWMVRWTDMPNVTLGAQQR